MKCDQCEKEIDNLLEQIEFFFGDELVRVKNNPETPICQDCLQDLFNEVMDGILGV